MVGARPLENANHMEPCYGVVMEQLVAVSTVLTVSYIVVKMHDGKNRSTKSENTPSGVATSDTEMCANTAFNINA